MIRLPIVFISLLLLSLPALAAPKSFSDVPQNHWAADAVKKMSDSGIMVGYPQGKFQGEKPVTRYELAVTLERFVHFVEASRAPLVDDAKKAKSATPSPKAPPAKPKAQSKVTTKALSSAPAKTSLDFLVSNGFVPKDSALTKDRGKPVDSELLADALTSVVSRLTVLEADRQAAGKN
jgi:hypothetical protein